MQLTSFTDYSLRTLLYLASQPAGSRVTAKTLAVELAIAHNHLSKIVHHLGHLGYLTTIRGKGGGLELGKAPNLINLGHLVQQLEPSLELVDCQQPPCPLRGQCQLKPLLNQASRAFIEVLAGQTLADLLPQAHPITLTIPQKNPTC